MARDNRIQMPSGMGGLVRYFDDYKSKIEIKPGYVIVLILFVMVIVMLLHLYGDAFMGM